MQQTTSASQVWVDIEGYYNFRAFGKQEVGEFEWVKIFQNSEQSIWTLGLSSIDQII